MCVYKNAAIELRRSLDALQAQALATTVLRFHFVTPVCMTSRYRADALGPSA